MCSWPKGTVLTCPAGTPASCSIFGEQERGKRSLERGLQHHRVSRRESGRDFVRDEIERKIKWRDSEDHTHREIAGPGQDARRPAGCRPCGSRGLRLRWQAGRRIEKSSARDRLRPRRASPACLLPPR